VCFIHTANSAHAEGCVPKHPGTTSKKSNSNFTSLRGALERLRFTAVASPPRQSGTTGLLLRPSSRACLHAAPGHLRRLRGDPPETKPLNADAARVTNSGECKNEFSYILADVIGSGSFFLHPERWIHHACVCTRLLSQSVPRESRTVAKVAFLEPISNSDVPSDAVVDIFIERSVPWYDVWAVSWRAPCINCPGALLVRLCQSPFPFGASLPLYRCP
jgi:hypothetical protein